MSRLVFASFILAIQALYASTVLAKTWHINHDGSGAAPTIQAGIDSASSGDTVLVGQGTYHERLRLIGKTLALLGAEGPVQTILSGATLGGDTLSILTIDEVDSSAYISGFTFQENGADSLLESRGGAITCSSYGFPTIEHNTFQNNFAGRGGAIDVSGFGEGPHIRSNTFFQNTARVIGGAIAVSYTDSTIIKWNHFESNAVLGGTGRVGSGGAIGVDFFGCVRAASNVFLRNHAEYGGAVFLVIGGDAILENNSFAFNFGTSPNMPGTIGATGSLASLTLIKNVIAMTTVGAGVTLANQSSLHLECNGFWQNAAGDYAWYFMDPVPASSDFHADPLFCDPVGGYLTVAPTSPCLPQNNSTCGQVGALGQGCDFVPVLPPPNPEEPPLLESPGILAGPNPFTQTLTVNYLSPFGTDPELEIFSVDGRLIAKWALRPGSGTVTWDGRDPIGRPVSSGIYFVRYTAGDLRVVRRVVRISN